MEPRGALQSIWSRRESLVTPSDSFAQDDENDAPLRLKFHAEPSVPVHLALEYEVVASEVEAERRIRHEQLSSSSSAASLEWQQQQPKVNGLDTNEKNNGNYDDDNDSRRSKATLRDDEVEKETKNRQWKLLTSFFFLIASGVGTVVSAKLQAIPMYVL